MRRFSSVRQRKLCAGCAWLALALFASGCASTRQSVKALVDASWSAHHFQPTTAQVQALPYAQLLVKGPLGNALMVLGNDDAGRTAWYSNDRRVVFLRDGLLVGTQGQPQDAVDISIEGENPFADLLALQGPVTIQRRYDWMPGYRFGAQATGTVRRTGPQNVEILGRSMPLEHFQEALHGDGVDALNEYWVDPASGYIMRSRQLVAPGVSLELTTLKPYQRRSPP